MFVDDTPPVGAGTACPRLAIVDSSPVARFRRHANMIVRTRFAPDVSLPAGIRAIPAPARLPPGSGLTIVESGLRARSGWDAHLIPRKGLPPNVTLLTGVRTLGKSSGYRQKAEAEYYCNGSGDLAQQLHKCLLSLLPWKIAYLCRIGVALESFQRFPRQGTVGCLAMPSRPLHVEPGGFVPFGRDFLIPTDLRTWDFDEDNEL